MKKYSSKNGSELHLNKGKYTFKISKSDWIRIGKEAQWINNPYDIDPRDDFPIDHGDIRETLIVDDLDVEFTIYYKITDEGEPRSSHSPGYPPEVEFIDFEINYISDENETRRPTPEEITRLIGTIESYVNKNLEKYKEKAIEDSGR